MVQTSLTSPRGSGWWRGWWKWWGSAAVLVRTAVGAVFLVALIEKVLVVRIDETGVHRGVDAFARLLDAQGLVGGWAAGWVMAMELALGVWLLSHHAWKAALVCAAVVLAAFSVYLTLVMQISAAEPCGCFGQILPGDWRTAMARNVTLGAGIGSVWVLDRLSLRRLG